ncbi:methyltransferase domain-containing protein [Cellulomonas sp. H30R-01]|uniref:bifunctional PIG-L family deacetylase/class I SAM-dependent methyltransferase n=1 Tax=Cellulomonas sp. H30R-01 TaxID=2704467 RepID=UPI00138D9FA2|nr:bifunctional PIG-L family deacetylase/class I SAM-dependent methyltransferase [Cellulomonas sp. H30R-01]QHT57279.1 methyltransferase domain-containing protein [Cellulomonas sp. H30R-01]
MVTRDASAPTTGDAPGAGAGERTSVDDRDASAGAAAGRVVFEGRDAPAASRDAWAADARWADLPALALPAGRTVVVAAHPDDESLAVGGLVAELAARGNPPEVVVLTDGAASHPGSPTLSPADLVARRADEVRAAVAVLSPASPVTLLGHPDGGLREVRAAAEADLRRLLGTAPVDTLVVPWRGDGHRDHRVAGEIGAALAHETGARLVEYPLWMWQWATPDDARVPWERLRVVDLADGSVVRRHRAVAAHRSQVHPSSDDPRDAAVVSPDLVAALDRDVDVLVVDDASATTLGQRYFDATYARRDDPWGFEDRWYEERKRAVTLAALPDARYGRVLEVGCSIGVLTADLATRGDELLAVDVAPAAVARARERVASAAHVRVEVGDVAARVPDGPWDLVVLSEVGYYLSRADLLRTARALRASLAPGGTVVAVHWRHPVADYPLTGDEVHRVLRHALDLSPLVRHEEADFVLDVLAADPRSVARRTGLV